MLVSHCRLEKRDGFGSKRHEQSSERPFISFMFETHEDYIAVSSQCGHDIVRDKRDHTEILREVCGSGSVRLDQGQEDTRIVIARE